MIRYNWDFDIVGVLPSIEYARSRFDKFPVFINTQNFFQYIIRPISETPSNFPNVSLFTGYPQDINESYGFEDNQELNNIERCNEVNDFFHDYLVVFRPVQKGEHFYISNVRLVPKPLGFTDTTTYVPVPVFNQNEHKMTYDELISRLQLNKFVGKIRGISTDTSDVHSLVIWKESSEEFRVLGEFEKHRYAHGGFLFNFKNLKSVSFKEEWFGDTISLEDNENLLFVGNDIYGEMLEVVESADELQSTEDPPKILSPVIIESQTTSVEEKGTEADFLQSFIQLTRELGYAYDPVDLINFHTAMKSSSLVILAGMSGTGKSQLVQLYGRALGMDDQQLSIIPVRPSWTDDADLIGYVDSIHMVYRPGDSGLVNTLIRASKEQERLFIVSFDEMNLARVEHYFSQFLSVLEMEPSRRKIKVYNEEVQQRLYNGAEFPHTIPIGDNIIFVGTVNLDESTYHFSDKVLDRANVISLNVLDFSDVMKSSYDKKRVVKRSEMTFGEYLSFCQEEGLTSFFPREVQFLTELNRCFKNVSRNLGFGPRVVRQIFKYLSNLPETTILSRELAFDLQILQRVFTKLRGPEEQLKPLIGSLNPRTGNVENGTIYKVLEDFTDISTFEQSYKILMSKARELKLYGYTV
ncbi:AAA family ATPase [Desulfosporosinus sp. Sb-LF]|uniref:McrB family protein n=1 Tax=Desulfosporosinus sp. Sb-LF TaxID=2560027 RepID=UPI00107F73C9|nr:AAA family ATPase [Desulfosporosinus sp. Sb-LF]TGE31298.1 AAA family ATPase [Desulfosporosinus sp. Sb-LF]